MNEKKIIVALDNNNLESTKSVVQKLKQEAFAFKIGYEFFLNFGLKGYEIIQKENVKIFLDLKLHDIPNTVKNGIQALSKLKPYFTTIHLSGGDEMQRAAVSKKNNTKIIGVTILTSLDSNQTLKYNYNSNIKNIVKDFAHYAIKNKLDGIVCSPQEIKIIKKISLDKLLTITPGIRPSNFINKKEDQKRFMTPKEAIKSGANYLVIGRPITQSKDPLKELITINSSLV